MKPLTLQEIRQTVNGKALGALPMDAPRIKSVCTDSRQIEPGCLFIAIKGENRNGHEYLPTAAAGGALAALVEEPPRQDLPNLHQIRVESTRLAMGKLATHVRKQMKSRVIAVAGSNGKTSTKYLLSAVLGAKLRGSISPKSFNNDIGVPLAIFPADPMQDYLVLEIGTNHHGEIRLLTEMAQPDVAVITNIGAEHLEGLGDLKGVCREEASIIKGLNPNGALVVNGDNPALVEAVAPYPGKKIYFGFNPPPSKKDKDNHLFATNLRCDEQGVRFHLNGNSRCEVFVPMLGRHSACNALAAMAVGRWMNLNESDIIESLAHAHGPEMRLQLWKVGGVTLINDAYNANPNSVAAALDTLRDLMTKGRRIAILGDMCELGDASEQYHREIGELAAKSNIDVLMCVGEKAKAIGEAAKKAGVEHIACFRDAATAAKMIPGRLRARDLVVVKASRSIGLESVATAIADKLQVHARKAAS